jgi:hypothetical protein
MFLWLVSGVGLVRDCVVSFGIASQRRSHLVASVYMGSSPLPFVEVCHRLGSPWCVVNQTSACSQERVLSSKDFGFTRS